MPAFLTDAIQKKTKTLKSTFDKKNPFCALFQKNIRRMTVKKNNKELLFLREHK